MAHRTLRTLAVLLAAVIPVEAAAAEPHAFSRLTEESFGASVNPLGVQNLLEVRWTRPLSSSPRPVLSDAHVAFGVRHALTPSYTRLGPWVEVAPLSVLSVRAGVDPSAYFGTFSSVLSFPGYTAAFDDDARRARGSEARAAVAARMYVAPTVRMKVGHVVGTSTAEVEWWRTSAKGPLFYEPERDTLLATDGGRCLVTTSALLWHHDMGPRGALLFGATHRLTYVSAAPANRSQRLGVVVVRPLGTRRFGVARPQVLASVTRYFDHPSRDGGWWAAAGLSFGIAGLER